MKRLKVNSKLKPLFTAKQQIIVILGGRGSGKSIGVGDILTFKMLTERADIYCLREFQNSIEDSVHRVFKSSIEDRLKLKNWTILKNEVVAPNGAKTTYKGASINPDSMQSAQGYKYSWVEEAHTLSQKSIDKLLPTILRNPGAKCIFTANPQSSGDPFSQRFIVPYQEQLEKHGYYEDDLHVIIVANWRDNPWWNEEQENLRSWDYENLSRSKYDWIWEGKFNDSVENAIIQPEWFDACIDAHIKLGIEPIGVEVLAHDPSDVGEDSKGLAYRHGIIIKDVLEKEDGDINQGGDWAINYAVNNKVDYFIWDCDGMGVGLNRQIKEALEPKKISPVMYKGSESPRDPLQIYEVIGDKPKSNKDCFLNQRAQGYWLLRDRMYKTYQAVVEGKYHNPDELISFCSDIKLLQALRAELCRIPTVNNGAGRIQLMSKDNMKKKGISSPNLGDSVMMAMFLKPQIAKKITPANIPLASGLKGRL